MTLDQTIRQLSGYQRAQLRRRLHAEMHGASSGVELALAAVCNLLTVEAVRRTGRTHWAGCPICAAATRRASVGRDETERVDPRERDNFIASFGPRR